MHADAFDRRADDYDTPLGIQQNSSVDSHGASGGGSYVWSNGFAGVAYTRFDSLYAIPGTELGEEKSRIDMTQDKIASRSEWRARGMWTRRRAHLVRLLRLRPQRARLRRC